MRAAVLAVVMAGCTANSPPMPNIDIQVSSSGWTKYTDQDTGKSFELQQAFEAIVFYGMDAAGQCASNHWRLPDASEWAIVSAVNDSGIEELFWQEEWCLSGDRYGFYHHKDRTFTLAENVPLDRYVTFRCAR